MNMSASFLVTLLVFLVLAVLLQARDQSGFISIDCGLPAKHSYTDDETGINYISDADFINTGVRKSVERKFQVGYRSLVWTLRSFPEGKRNCYKINITMGSKYLIRVEFLYGNYDGLDSPTQFDLLLGANKWDTVTLSNGDGHGYKEVIHTPSRDYVEICLVNTGLGTPFVSSIELRILKNDTYVIKSRSLKLYYRVDLGPPDTGKTSRYRDDAYDRLWSPFKENHWTQLNVSHSAGPLSQKAQNDYQLPAAVMRTAVEPVDASAPLVINWPSQDQNDPCYYYMHFMEVANLKNNQTREFNILLDGKLSYQNLVPSYLSANTIFSTSPSRAINISLEKTQRSTLPPIINAIEVYRLTEFHQSETLQGDVDAITTIKSVYGLKREWQGDPCAPVAYLWDGLNCTYHGNDYPRITALNLSSSRLTGTLDPSFSQLTMLEKLDLSGNSLNGQVPDFLSQLQHLKILNLAGNNLTGSVPSVLVEKAKQGSLSLTVDRNPYLCESGQCNKKKKIKPIVAAAAVIGLLIILVATAAMLWTLKMRKPKAMVAEQTPRKINQDDASLQYKNKVYSYSDVLEITNNFNKIIGKGAFGTVYLGYVDDTPVAVKMLSPSSVQGYRQFQAEVKLLMRVHHRNLTSLIGYCNEGTNKGLIYEYMANGNLQEHLSGKDSQTKFLTWEDRLHIAADAASGLEYLHSGCKPPIIHRDVKSSNILLTENFQAKISDFGLSKIIPTGGGSHVSTVVAGTPGYLDPDYRQSSRLTEKSDVYSFGVVLLEIITSQPVIARNHERTHISQWVRAMVATGDIKGIVDSRLGGDFDCNSAWKAVEIAMACVSSDPNRRPIMSEIVNELRECLATELAQTKYGGANTGYSVELASRNQHTEFTPLAR